MYGKLFARSLLLLAAGTSFAHAEPDLNVQPTEGIWWSSEAPGTGVAFNIDAQDRWFAAIYLYDEEGLPTFLTMQGDAIEYEATNNIDPDAAPSVYARATSELIRSEGGQCLKCPWSKATASASGDGEAEIAFYGRNRAELTVGDWSIRLAPLVDSVEPVGTTDSWAKETVDLSSEYYSIAIETETVKAVVLGFLSPSLTLPGAPPTGTRQYDFSCWDCQVGMEVDETLEEMILLGRYAGAVTFACPRTTPQKSVDCVVKPSGWLGFQADSVLIDQAGEEIIVIDHGDGDQRAPGKIVIRALPQGWKPTLP